MSKNNELDKHAVDDLFARKLGNAVLPTNADGFARLQARMEKTQAEKKPGFVVWRNPNIQRFMAIAACLLLICLFGWVYLSNNASDRVQGNQMATIETEKRPETNAPATPQGNLTTVPNAEPSDELTSQTNQLVDRVAVVTPKSNKQKQAGNAPERHSSDVNATPRTGLAQNKPPVQPQIEQVVAQKAMDQTPLSPSPDQVAAVKPVATQRVLVVTIAEPERLVAARQAVKMELMETALANVGKPEKAAKPGFWEQVRRVKEGEAFTRPDGSTDERGLLSRAFDGLKNSIDKDKTARQ